MSATVNTSVVPSPSQATTHWGAAIQGHVSIEFRGFWRSVVTLAFIVLLPVGFYVGFGLAFRSEAGMLRVVDDHHITQANLSYAGTLTFALLSVALANVAIGLAMRRHSGLFRRFRTTPVPPVVVMGAFLVNVLLTAVIVLLTITAIGVLGMGVELPYGQLPQFAGALALGFLCIAPVGTALSLLPPSADAAVPIANGVFFPLAFLSGTFFTFPLGEVGDTIMSFLPAKPLLTLLTGALSQDGPTWDLKSTLILLAWGLVMTLVTLRFFRWASERESRPSRRARTQVVDSDGR